jgi:biotin carboxyl carrier protein
MNLDTSDDSVLIALLFPNLAIDYLREPGPDAKDQKRPAEVSTVDAPTPAPPPTPAAPAAPATPPAAEFDVEVEGEVFKVRVSGAGMTVMPGVGAAAAAQSPAPTAPRTGEGTVIAPMQGLIVKIPVKVGDAVKLGDVVAVLEAMKMQNDIVTTVAGSVREVYVKEGEVVSPSQPLLNVG